MRQVRFSCLPYRGRTWPAVLLATCTLVASRAPVAQAEEAKPAAPSAPGKLLRYRHEAGRRLESVLTREMSSRAQIRGMLVTTSLAQEVRVTAQTEALDADGNARVKVKIQQFKTRLVDPQGNQVALDSDQLQAASGQALQMVPWVRALLRAEHAATVNDRGELIDTDLPQQVAAAVQQDEQLAAHVGQILNEENLKQLRGTSAVIMPVEPVRSGDTWRQARELNMPLLGKQTAQVQYTYLGPVVKDDRQLEQINYTMQIKFQAPMELPFQVEFQQQSLEGEILLDPAAGYVVESQFRQRIRIVLTIGEEKVPQEIESRSSTITKPAGS